MRPDAPRACDAPETARRRGRPRGFDAGQALERMREVFARQGYAETTLDDLCAASGLARPSLYAAFGDKERVYLAALEDYARRSAERLDAALSAPGRLEARLAAMFAGAAAAYCRTPEQPGCMIGGTAAAAAPVHPDIRAAAARLRAAAAARLARAFAQAGAVDAGDEAGDEASARGEMALAALESMGLRARLGEEEARLTAFGAACAARLAGDLAG